jgi:hypothetical protein
VDEMLVNQRIAEEICDLGKCNGKQFQRGDCVALLDGKVVAVANDLDTALRTLRALAPEPHRGMLFEVAPRIVEVIR